MATPTAEQKRDALIQFVETTFLTEIGRVITQWSLMEALLETCIWRAGGMSNNIGRIVTSPTQVLGKINLLQAFLNHSHPILADQFKPVGDYVAGCLTGTRNTVAHGLWSARSLNDGSNRGLVSKFHAKGRLTFVGGRISIGELEGLAVDIADVTSWLMDLAALLPEPPQQSDELIHKSRDTPTLPRNASRKQQALQPVTVLPRDPPKAQKRPPKRPS